MLSGRYHRLWIRFNNSFLLKLKASWMHLHPIFNFFWLLKSVFLLYFYFWQCIINVSWIYKTFLKTWPLIWWRNSSFQECVIWSGALTSTDFSTAVTIIRRDIELLLPGPCLFKNSIPRSRLSALLLSVCESWTESLGSQATAFHNTLTVLENTVWK